METIDVECPSLTGSVVLDDQPVFVGLSYKMAGKAPGLQIVWQHDCGAISPFKQSPELHEVCFGTPIGHANVCGGCTVEFRNIFAQGIGTSGRWITEPLWKQRIARFGSSKQFFYGNGCNSTFGDVVADLIFIEALRALHLECVDFHVLFTTEYTGDTQKTKELSATEEHR